MNLRVLLPFQVFADEARVTHIVAETREGCFGILPRRLDCVAALTPGILMYRTGAGNEVFLAVDGGVLVKTGAEVCVSAHRAMRGADLGDLRAAVEREFMTVDAREQSLRAVMAKLETGFLRRLASLQHE